MEGAEMRIAGARVLLGVYADSRFVPIDMTRDGECIRHVAQVLLEDCGDPNDANPHRARMVQSERARLEALFADYGISLDASERMEV
jgi:hypothetical protein